MTTTIIIERAKERPRVDIEAEQQKEKKEGRSVCFACFKECVVGVVVCEGVLSMRCSYLNNERERESFASVIACAHV